MKANKPQSANPSSKPRANLGMMNNQPKVNNLMGNPGSNYNIAAIMKKFKHENQVPLYKKKEYEVTHMPRNTLLDQRNKIEPWEEDGQEKEEVSKTLKNLRQKFDNVHKEV